MLLISMEIPLIDITGKPWSLVIYTHGFTATHYKGSFRFAISSTHIISMRCLRA